MVILSHSDALTKMSKISDITLVLISSSVEQRMENIGNIAVYASSTIPVAEFSNVKYPFIVAASTSKANKDIIVNFKKL